MIVSWSFICDHANVARNKDFKLISVLEWSDLVKNGVDCVELKPIVLVSEPIGGIDDYLKNKH